MSVAREPVLDGSNRALELKVREEKQSVDGEFVSNSRNASEIIQIVADALDVGWIKRPIRALHENVTGRKIGSHRLPELHDWRR
jgi:hypothetical protein